MMRIPQAPNATHVPWHYLGKPCNIAAVEVIDGEVSALYVVQNGVEIQVPHDESGEFPGLTYATG